MRVLLVSEGAHELSGALETLVRRVARYSMEIETDKVSRQDLHAHHGKGRGYFKRAVRWLLEARKRGYDALVLVIDEDDDADRITEIEQAQSETPNCAIRRALGVAIHSFDAWMLADAQALTKVFGKPTAQQPLPETISNPKPQFLALCAKSELDLSQAAVYAQVAAELALPILEARCPKGFGTFAARLRAI